MSNSIKNKSISDNLVSIATAFHRLGWLGFWAQILLGLLPICLLVFGMFFSQRINQESWDLGALLGFACELFLLFTIYWFYRYTQMAAKLKDDRLRPPKTKIIQCLSIGLIVNLSCTSFAVLVAMGDVLSPCF